MQLLFNVIVIVQHTTIIYPAVKRTSLWEEQDMLSNRCIQKWCKQLQKLKQNSVLVGRVKKKLLQISQIKRIAEKIKSVLPVDSVCIFNSQYFPCLSNTNVLYERKYKQVYVHKYS